MKKKDRNGIDSWQPTTDMLTGLLLILLLIILLLMLYILRLPKKENDYKHQGMSESVSTEYHAEEDTEHEEEEEDDDSDNGGGEEEATTEEIIPTSGGHPEDEGMKSAVYAVIIDAEKKKIIEKKDVEFELYQDEKSLQTLYTYYPKKIAYKKFATTKKGDFYLPEKVWEGNYFFRQLTEVDGYNSSGDTGFSVDRLYDWPNPCVVKIPMSPASSIIYVSMEDQETSESVPEGEFRIVAGEDIITKDGTVRFQEGESVGEIEINDKGEGQSKKLYLGKYKLVQTKIPKDYAATEKDITVTVKKQMKKEKPTVVKNQKTTLVCSLTDELYPEEDLSDVSFTLEDEEGNKQDLKTDGNGMFTVSGLKKDMKYSLTQETLPNGYLSKADPKEITVDKKGFIEKKATKELNLSNRKIRVSVAVKDLVLKSILSNEKVVLEKEGKKADSWTSNGQSVEITSLAPGDYKIKVKNTETPIVIKNTAEIQDYTVQVLTVRGVVAIALGIGLVLVAIFGIYRLIVQLRKRKDEDE